MRQGIQRLNAIHGTPEEREQGFHETITVAWMKLVEATMRRDGKGADAESFLVAHPELQDTRILLEFYSRDRLMSWQAKERFVEPDLNPIEPLAMNADNEQN